MDQPILFYDWAPTGFFGQVRFTRLKEPKYKEACWKTMKDLTNTKPCGSAAPSVNLRFGVTTDIPDNDAIVAVMSKVKYRLVAFNKIIAEISDTKKAPARSPRNTLKNKPPSGPNGAHQTPPRKVRDSLNNLHTRWNGL
jgi:glycine betaine/proline transport system substrate-binding protein